MLLDRKENSWQYRRQIGSANRNNTQLKIAKIHQRIANIRKDAIHKLTSWLCKNHAVIGLEDLNVSGMMRNHKLAGAIADSSFYEIRRQAEYKANWYGCELVFAALFYPSSKTCSSCGHIQDMPLKERVFNCSACGEIKDRDFNASLSLGARSLGDCESPGSHRNLERYAEGYSVKACGVGSADTLRKTR